MAGFQRRKQTKRKRGEGPRVGGPFSTTNEVPIPEPMNRTLEASQVTDPRVMIVFGSPLSGVSEALQVLHEVSRMGTNLVRGGDWLDAAQQSLDGGNAVTLVDASALCAEHVQDAYDRRLVYPGSGALVRLWSSPEEALRRAQAKGRSDVTRDSINDWGKGILGLEDRIHKLSLPYFMVPNEYGRLDNTIAELARRAGITD